MDKNEYRKKLEQLGSRKDLIPGVHNYCDRWCERCPFTSKCGSYALTEGLDSNQEDVDLENDKFWEDLHMIFEVTIDMITEKAVEMGIDLSEMDDVEIDHELPENNLTELSKEYSRMVIEWLQDANSEINEKAQQLILIDGSKALKLNDAIEVIQWYSLFISAKIHRAFMDLGLEDEEEDFINDNLGSSKIAVIAIDRSIAAFGFLMEIMVLQEDSILKFLYILSKIKQELLESFPKAMEFKRPGFDD